MAEALQCPHRSLISILRSLWNASLPEKNDEGIKAALRTRRYALLQTVT
jgi:hypothetical protein